MWWHSLTFSDVITAIGQLGIVLVLCLARYMSHLEHRKMLLTVTRLIRRLDKNTKNDDLDMEDTLP
jgi:hypothetical protein